MTTLEALRFLQKVRHHVKSSERVNIQVYDDYTIATLVVYGKFTIEDDMTGVQLYPDAGLNAIVMEIFVDEVFPSDSL